MWMTVLAIDFSHMFETQEPIRKRDGEVLLKSRMREIFTSGSVRGLIVTSGLLPYQEVRYGLLLDIG